MLVTSDLWCALAMLVDAGSIPARLSLLLYMNKPYRQASGQVPSLVLSYCSIIELSKFSSHFLHDP